MVAPCREHLCNSLTGDALGALENVIFIAGELSRGTNTVEEEIGTHVHAHAHTQDKQIRSHYTTAWNTSQDVNTGLEASLV